MPSPLRARLRRAVLGKTDAKIARQQRQLDAQAKQLTTSQAVQAKQTAALAAKADKASAADAQLTRSVARLNEQVAELTRRADGLASSVASLTERATRADADQRARDVEFELRRAHVGALETRLGRIEETSAPALQASIDPSPQAFDLLGAIRREHEQIRVRMQIISLYEERLRRVEESLLALYSGDERHRL